MSKLPYLLVIVMACGGKATNAPAAIHPDPRCTVIAPMPPTPAPQSAEAWAWARSIAPALEALVPAVTAKPADAPWWRAGVKTLYAPRDWLGEGTAKSCVPITVTAENGELHAFVTEAGVDAGKYGCRSELVLGATAELVDAGCPTRGQTGYGIIGDGRAIGGSLVIEGDTLAYDAVPITLSPRCRWITVERPSCTQKTCRTCQIALQPSTSSSGVGFGAAKDPAAVIAQGPCEPCPVDHAAETIPRLAEILHGRIFQHRLGGGIRFSTTKSACEAR